MDEPSYFDDEDYFSRVFENAKNSEVKSPIKEALKLAHDIRKFEIGLFWTRGTYFWAFILAAFTAHFAILNKFFHCKKCDISFDSFTDLDIFPKMVLLITALICLFFCMAWVLVNKGSKFWQKNWESHIDQLEDEITGKMYKAILNTNSEKFKSCPLLKDAYDYSVTKVTTVTSIFLASVSLGLVIFYLYVICYKWIKDISSSIVIFALVAIFFVWNFARLFRCKGNDENKTGQKKWFMRSKK